MERSDVSLASDSQNMFLWHARVDQGEIQGDV